MRCSSCGAEASGNFCAACGAALSSEVFKCSSCGKELQGGSLYCDGCGQPTGADRRKPRSAHLPWVVSFVVLAVFALGIAYLVQRQSIARIGDAPITGGLPEAEGGGAAPSGGMPDLASMSAREAADRLFDRSMREIEAGNEEQAAQFANMGLQAYGEVSPDEMDMDAIFHIGMLHLAIGDATTASGIADRVLAEDASHALALVLARRAAAASDDPAAAEEFAERLRAAVAAGELDMKPEYAPHRSLIEREAGVASEESPQP